MKYINKYLLGLALALAAPSSYAASFNWANTVLSTNVQSDGSTLSTTFTFVIGGLGDGFDLADPTTWVDNFNVVDTDLYNETGLNEIGRSPVNATPETIGVQPYIFGYSTAEGFGLPGSEGLLFTSSNWVPFPDPADPVNPTYGTVEVTDVLFGSVVGDPIVGGVSGSSLGSFTHGFEGEQIEANPVALSTTAFPDFFGPVEFQSFGFTAVPEPSGAVLLLLGSCVLLRRKRS